MANKKNVALWTEALRSGEYQKTHGGLSETNEDGIHCYCALGLGCEIHREKYPDSWKWISHEHKSWRTLYPIPYIHRIFIGMMPEAICAWYGLTQRQVREVEHMNDGRELSFVEVADYLDSL